MSQNTILIRRYKDMKYSEYLKTEYWQNIKDMCVNNNINMKGNPNILIRSDDL